MQIRSNDHARKLRFGKQTYVEVKPVSSLWCLNKQLLRNQSK